MTSSRMRSSERYDDNDDDDDDDNDKNDDDDYVGSAIPGLEDET